MTQSPRTVQPYLHDLVSCLSAPSVVLGGRDGQIRPEGAQGWLRDDRRLLSRLEVRLDGAEPEAVGSALAGADSARFTGVARFLGDTGADPTVRVERLRTVGPDTLREHLTLVNDARVEVTAELTVRVAADLAPTSRIKEGTTAAPVPVRAKDADLAWGDGLRLRSAPEPDRATGDDEGTGTAELAWRVTLPAHTSWSVELTADGPSDGLFTAPTHGEAPRVEVRSRATDLELLAKQGIADLAALRMADPDHPADTFVGAGSPWFFTLFGRDSLWVARMLLPLGTETAEGTLGTLARRQGRAEDPATAEQHGRILHEVRAPGADDEGHILPPVYYGTIDATPLWVTLLHEARLWGMSEDRIRPLLPHLRAALDWITGPADADGDGFLDYVDTHGTGLANQGWKDSGDSIQWPDGSIAQPPIRLSEAQAYAHEAALAGAELLEAIEPGHHPVAAYRSWAGELRARFRSAFWVRDGQGPFPAIALDGDGTPVATATSNLGHLLGTGLLDGHESALVADRLAAHDLDAGYGLRTMSSTAAGFNPLGYHAGTVWPHDTAIAVQGLSRAGGGVVAASLADGLLRAAPAFEHRLPELFGGTDGRAGEPVLAYPASCRPQAWAAASVLPLLSAALGLRADVPAGELRVSPDPAFAHWFPLTVDGLRVGGHAVTVEVDSEGKPSVYTDAPLRVAVTDRR
ncbi:amylo-alpha-1,6-glucosidase [Nocardiopsis oceani]